MAPAVVALSGFMGSGKTTAGRLVAATLGRRFVDLDHEVERREKCTVADVFAREGETGFRRAELAALEEVLGGVAPAASEADGGLVLALGGGTLTQAPARALLEARGGAVVVYLQTLPEEAWERVEHSGRPLARSREAFAALAAEREDVYRESADLVIHTAGLTPLEVAERVVKMVLSS